jgi:hypothetical protein
MRTEPRPFLQTPSCASTMALVGLGIGASLAYLIIHKTGLTDWTRRSVTLVAGGGAGAMIALCIRHLAIRRQNLTAAALLDQLDPVSAVEQYEIAEALRLSTSPSAAAPLSSSAPAASAAGSAPASGLATQQRAAWPPPRPPNFGLPRKAAPSSDRPSYATLAKEASEARAWRAQYKGFLYNLDPVILSPGPVSTQFADLLGLTAEQVRAWHHDATVLRPGYCLGTTYTLGDLMHRNPNIDSLELINQLAKSEDRVWISQWQLIHTIWGDARVQGLKEQEDYLAKILPHPADYPRFSSQVWGESMAKASGVCEIGYFANREGHAFLVRCVAGHYGFCDTNGPFFCEGFKTQDEMFQVFRQWVEARYSSAQPFDPKAVWFINPIRPPS